MIGGGRPATSFIASEDFRQIWKGEAMRPALVCFVVMLLPAGSCWCQGSRMTESFQRWEIYGGLALTGPNPSQARSGGAAGFSGYPLGWLGVEGELSVLQGSSGAANTTTLTD